jgi:hypothetical protein
MMEAAIVPYAEGPTGFVKYRWLSALHMSFPKRKHSTELLKWIKGHQESKTSWEDFQVAFILKFAKDSTFTQAKKTLESCAQRADQDVADFYSDFIDYARDADFGAREPPLGWETQSNLLADKFLSKLQAPLIAKVIDDAEYATVANDVVQLSKLAAKVETAQMAKGTVLAALLKLKGNKTSRQRDGEAAKNKKRFTKNQRDNSGANVSNSKREVNSANKKVLCRRCKRLHVGGRSNCWAQSFEDGTPITEKATAEVPAWFVPRATNQQGNNRKRKSGKEETKDQRAIKRRKKIGRMLAGRGQVTFNADQEGDEADLDLEVEDESAFDAMDGDVYDTSSQQ